MAGFDGVAKKGKTVGKQIGIDGPKVPSMVGGKAKHGVTGVAMKAMGRNIARAMNQKRSGRGG
jgi:hypothetical protein